MTDLELAAYIGRMNDATTPAELVAISKEIAGLPASQEKATLQRTIRAMMVRRAVES